MMILKTRALNLLFLFISVSAGAEGFNTFDCLRDMMPLTERGSFQRQRVNVERPFMAGEKYMVFPEVIARKVTGFYVYDGKAAYYYDTIEARTEHGLSASPIAALAERASGTIIKQAGALGVPVHTGRTPPPGSGTLHRPK